MPSPPPSAQPCTGPEEASTTEAPFAGSDSRATSSRAKPVVTFPELVNERFLVGMEAEELRYHAKFFGMDGAETRPLESARKWLHHRILMGKADAREVQQKCLDKGVILPPGASKEEMICYYLAQVLPAPGSTVADLGCADLHREVARIVSLQGDLNMQWQQVLNLNPNEISEKAILSATRKISLILHPDKRAAADERLLLLVGGHKTCDEAFKKVQAAKDIGKKAPQVVPVPGSGASSSNSPYTGTSGWSTPAAAPSRPSTSGTSNQDPWGRSYPEYFSSGFSQGPFFPRQAFHRGPQPPPPNTPRPSRKTFIPRSFSTDHIFAK